MASSGLTVADECSAAHDRIKTGKNRPQYVVYKLSDDLKQIIFDKEVSVDNSMTAEESWNAFCNQLPPKSPVFSLYDVRCKNEEGQLREKLMFVYWCPDTSSIKNKMVSASSKDALMKKLGIGEGKNKIEASDLGDLQVSELLDKIGGKELVMQADCQQKN